MSNRLLPMVPVASNTPEAPFAPIAITQGDPAGIGPEIVVQAFQREPDLLRHCVVVGDVPTVRRAAALVAQDDLPWPVAVLSEVSELASCPPRCIPLWPVRAAQRQGDVPPWGQVSALAGQLAGDCVRMAAQAALRGEVAALVTAPLNKAALAAAGPPHAGFAGHTDMLQALAAEHLGVTMDQCPVRMMLANDELRVVLLSIHVSLREALAAVTQDNVLQTLEISHRALSGLLGRAPRIGVAGLNPHSGEGGLFGREEIDILMPALAQARARGLQVSDPQPPDTVFMRARTSAARTGEFDVVLAMYHDQGLIPVKYLGLDKGVNVTLGLPFVRTSPDHGTAFDIAGKGVADPSSLIAAIRMARSLIRAG